MPTTIGSNYHMISEAEVLSATAYFKADRMCAQSKLKPAERAAEYAEKIAPFIAIQTVAFVMLNYIRAFQVLHFLNSNIANYAVPAVASTVSNKLAEKIRPVNDAIGFVAGRTTKAVGNAVQLARMTPYERSLLGSSWQVIVA